MIQLGVKDRIVLTVEQMNRFISRGLATDEIKSIMNSFVLDLQKELNNSTNNFPEHFKQEMVHYVLTTLDRSYLGDKVFGSNKSSDDRVNPDYIGAINDLINKDKYRATLVFGNSISSVDIITQEYLDAQEFDAKKITVTKNLMEAYHLLKGNKVEFRYYSCINPLNGRDNIITIHYHTKNSEKRSTLLLVGVK